MPPPRYIPESVTEHDGIVSNVLESLSSSIGKEYSATLYYVKPPNAGSLRAKTSSPRAKTISIPTSPDKASSTSLHFVVPPALPPFLEMKPQITATGVSPSNTTGVFSPTTTTGLTPDDIFSPSLLTPSLDNQVTLKTLEKGGAEFELAWRKIAPSQDPKVMSKIKKYLMENIIVTGKDSSWKDVLSGIEDIEMGCLQAAEAMEHLKKQKLELEEKLKQVTNV